MPHFPYFAIMSFTRFPHHSLLMLALLLLFACQSSPETPQEGSIVTKVFDPFAQPPGSEPELFGEGTVSTRFSVRDFTLSPAEDAFIFTVESPGSKFSVLMQSVKEEATWTEPEILPFSGHYRDLEAAFSPDGQELFFCSVRPMQGDTAAGDFNLWKVTRAAEGWGQPAALGPEVNSEDNEFYPSLTAKGDLYFTGPQEGPGSLEDIFVCRKTETGYAPREKLPEAINTEGYEYNAFIDPNEQFLIFGSYGREDGLGGGDLYIAHKDENGAWLPAENLGEAVNSTAMDYCPFVTPDGQYLFFTSSRSNLKTHYPEGIRTADFLQLLESPLNGSTNIYWKQWQTGQ